jgi:isopentenyldiphosphate isomerase
MPAPGSSSLVDWVDAADKPIAQVPRKEVFLRRAGFRVVHIFVFNEEGSLLLQQLGKDRERSPLKWGSSVAGYLNAGEQYLDGAVRRLWEELAVEAPLSKFGSVVMLDQGARKFITLYLASASGVVVNEPGHIESLRFESVANVEAWLSRSPDDFTETFRFLFRFYRSTLDLITATV